MDYPICHTWGGGGEKPAVGLSNPSRLAAPLLLTTDQDACFGASGTTEACGGTGQDASAAHLQPPAPRFFPQGAIVEDRWTGLRWARSAALGTFPMTYAEAIRFVQAISAEGEQLSGHWRLPERRELFSLISHRLYNPALPAGHPFEDVFDGYYWTGTVSSRLPDQAWTVHLGGGRVFRGMRHHSCMVWPVSGCWPWPRRLENRFCRVDGSVVDRGTNRAWRFDEALSAEPLTWDAALDRIRSLNRRRTGGHDDWRLPNIRELESLCDLERHSPAVPVDGLSGEAGVGFWSSTTSMVEPRYGWVLYTRDGEVGVGFKAKPDFRAVAVRTTDGS